MKQQQATEIFLAGRRVLLAKFVAHHYKEVSNKAKKVVGVVNLYEVQCADGKAPTVQVWCPRSVQTVGQLTLACRARRSCGPTQADARVRGKAQVRLARQASVSC